MQAAQNIPGEKLKLISIILSAATLAFSIWFIIKYAFVAAIIKFWAFPGFALAFALIPDEKKKEIVVPKPGMIAMYVIHAAWAVFAVLEIISMIDALRIGVDYLGFGYYLPLVLLVVCFAVNDVFSCLYFHIYRAGSALNTQGYNQV